MITKEEDKLFQVGFIKEMIYPKWIATMVMVKKTNKKWWICIDFTDLNKVCPKDSYLLSKIDQLVDATSGHELLSFMDDFFGYNQIQIAPEDKDKTSFITNWDLFCYRIMFFGLKNTGATYQCLINKVFND